MNENIKNKYSQIRVTQNLRKMSFNLYNMKMFVKALKMGYPLDETDFASIKSKSIKVIQSLSKIEKDLLMFEENMKKEKI